MFKCPKGKLNIFCFSQQNMRNRINAHVHVHARKYQLRMQKSSQKP